MSEGQRKRQLSESAKQANKAAPRKRPKYDDGGGSAGGAIDNAPDANVTTSYNTSNVSDNNPTLRRRRQRKNQSDVEGETDFAEETQDQKDPDYMPGATKKQRDAETRAKVEEAAMILGIRDEDMKVWQEAMHLSTYFACPRKRSQDQSQSKSMSASTTDRDTFGDAGWICTNQSGKTKPSSHNAVDFYQPITPEAGNVSWDAQPFLVKAGAKKIELANKSDRRIKHCWKWMLTQLLAPDLALEVSKEWNAIGEQAHPRPELPAQYEAALKELVQGKRAIKKTSKKTSKSITASQRSNMADTPDTANTKSLKPLTPPKPLVIKAETPKSGAVDREEFPSIHQTLSPETSALAGIPEAVDPSFQESKQDSDGTPNPFVIQKAEVLAQKLIVIPQAEMLAQKLMEENDLPAKPKLDDARLLAALLKPHQDQYDRIESKRNLCRVLNEIEKNRREGSHPVFRYVEEETIQKTNEIELQGNIASTADAEYICDSSMEVFRRWAEFRGMSPGQQGQINTHPGARPQGAGSSSPAPTLDGLPGILEEDVKSPAELAIERSVGPLFMGLFKFDGLYEYTGVQMKFPKHLRQFDICPYPDYAVRPRGINWSHWPNLLAPCVGSGDAKPWDNRTESWEVQLGFNSVSTLIILICVYLDLRKSAEEPLFPWMWIPAWIYTEEGFILYIHYPSAEFGPEGKGWVWKFQSLELTTAFGDIWQKSQAEKVRASAAMNRIRSHMAFVLEQVRVWTKTRGQYGTNGMVDKLIARARYEDKGKGYNWLLEQAGVEKVKTKLGP